jgi:hypothetical protein
MPLYKLQLLRGADVVGSESFSVSSDSAAIRRSISCPERQDFVLVSGSRLVAERRNGRWFVEPMNLKRCDRQVANDQAA